MTRLLAILALAAIASLAAIWAVLWVMSDREGLPNVEPDDCDWTWA